MKKRYFVVVIVLAFFAGMMAGVGGFGWANNSPVWVYINGELLSTSPGPREIDGRVYVPLRAVSESMGANVGWDGRTSTAFIATQRDALTDIEIVGDAAFQKAMRDALQLLKDKAPDEYKFVGMYVRKIILDPNETTPGTYSRDMVVHISADWKPDPYWWAGILTHEAYHVYQMYNAIDVTQKQEEYEAWKRSLAVLKKCNAPKWMVDYMLKSPYAEEP